MLKVILTLILSLSIGTSGMAAEYLIEPKSAEQQLLERQMDAGTLWLQNLVKNIEHEPDVVEFLKRFQRLVPFHGTLVETGSTMMTTLLRVEFSKDRLLLLRAIKGRLQLLVGAPVSVEAMAIAHYNSGYLLSEYGEGKKKFTQLLQSVEEANKEIEAKYGAGVLRPKDKVDPFNPTLMSIGDKAAVYLELQPDVDLDPLRSFLMALNRASCASLLGQIRQ